ncbi:hypothetical protein OAN307_c18630 [Octadecabacter antarcticus 307]|uniref:Uncharacterized protein n=1 Tax=Octadecabacter antarcticus 307 TaxID=391626 RepID=M9RAY6_9RHOB|nr:hypothetical protein OAN307_c18630 [Octadecabacter antarcticus 307]
MLQCLIVVTEMRTPPSELTTSKTADPVLQPFQLRHLTLRNRIFSSAHAPSFAEEGHPRDRYLSKSSCADAIFVVSKAAHASSPQQPKTTTTLTTSQRNFRLSYVTGCEFPLCRKSPGRTQMGNRISHLDHNWHHVILTLGAITLLDIQLRWDFGTQVGQLNVPTTSLKMFT